MRIIILALTFLLYTYEAFACKCVRLPEKADYEKADIFFEAEITKSHFKNEGELYRFCQNEDSPQEILLNYEIRLLKTLKKNKKSITYNKFILKQKYHCRNTCKPPVFYEREKYALSANIVQRNEIKVSFYCGKWGHSL